MPVTGSSPPAAATPTTTTTWVHKEPSEWWLDCECSTPKVLLSLLQSLSDCQHTTFYCSPTAGLTIHTHPNPQFQCTLELPVGLFSKFQSQECDFCVSHQALLDCLGVLTIENPLQLSLKYHGPSEVLKLEATLRQGVSSAAISGMVPPEASAELSAAFGASPIMARLLCSSKDLQDWAELDTVPGVASIQLAVQPQAITGSVVGHSSQCEVVLPLPVDAPTTKVQYSYPFQAWKRAIKPLEVAKETCLSINADGILAIQHQMVHDDIAAFCDSLVLPLVDDDGPTDRNQHQHHVDDDPEGEAASTMGTSTGSPSSNYHPVQPLHSQGTRSSRSMTTPRPQSEIAFASPRVHSTRHDDSSTIPSVVTQQQQQQRHFQKPQPLHQNMNNHDHDSPSHQEDDSETEGEEDQHNIDNDDNDKDQPSPQEQQQQHYHHRPLLFGTARGGGTAAVAPLSSTTSSLSLTPATTTSTYPPPSTHRRSRKRLTRSMDRQQQQQQQRRHSTSNDVDNDDNDNDDEDTDKESPKDTTTANQSRGHSRRRRQRRQSSTSDSSGSQDDSSSSPLITRATATATRPSLQQRAHHQKSPSQESYSEILYCSSPEVVYGGD